MYAHLRLIAVSQSEGFLYVGGYVMGFDYGNVRIDDYMGIDDE